MKWNKKGLIFCPAGEADWMVSHCMIPTPWLLQEKIRVFFTSCDKNGVGRIGYADFPMNDFPDTYTISPKPVIDIGRPGTFDENGVVACSLAENKKGDLYLYYVGFELGTKIRYRLLTGLAVSSDGGESFEKIQPTPILERSPKELYFRCGPFCIYDFEAELFRLWYVAGSDWINLEGKPFPVYNIRYLESQDGVHWGKEGKVCIDIENEREYGFGRPYVWKEGDSYHMIYSIRVKHLGYRMGYALSKDGINWERKDEEVGIDVSPQGWDSEMICYGAYLSLGNKAYLLYNGNQYGKTGFGYAERIDL